MEEQNLLFVGFSIDFTFPTSPPLMLYNIIVGLGSINESKCLLAIAVSQRCSSTSPSLKFPSLWYIDFVVWIDKK